MSLIQRIAPPPLVGAEVDLTDYHWMPMPLAALTTSDLAAHASAEGYRAGVYLLCAAWTQKPAASLPDDDQALALLAGFGRDVEGWRRIRGEALEGWTLCADGRFYHPMLAARALAAWDEKRAALVKRKADRERKAGKSAEQKKAPAEVARNSSGIPAEVARRSRGTPAEFQAMSAAVPSEVAADRRGEEKIEETTSTARAGAREEAPDDELSQKAQEASRVARRCVEAIGAAGNAPSLWRSGLVGDASRWLEAGCDPELDIYPVIAARAAKAPPQTIRSLKLFGDDPIHALRRRMAPVQEIDHGSLGSSRPLAVVSGGGGHGYGSGSALLRGAALAAERAERERAARLAAGAHWGAPLWRRPTGQLIRDISRCASRRCSAITTPNARRRAKNGRFWWATGRRLWRARRAGRSTTLAGLGWPGRIGASGPCRATSRRSSRRP